MVEFEKTGDVLVAALKGEIDLHVAAPLREALDRAIEGLAFRHLVIDFRGVTFIDSTGLGVLLGRYRRVAGAGGTVAVTGLSSAVRRVVELSGLLRVTKEFGSRAEAVAVLEGGGAGA